MKMMRNMGYVPGQGLGANKQGIVEPVQAVLRPGRAAIGAYGKEAKGPKFGGNILFSICHVRLYQRAHLSRHLLGSAAHFSLKKNNTDDTCVR